MSASADLVQSCVIHPDPPHPLLQGWGGGRTSPRSSAPPTSRLGWCGEPRPDPPHPLLQGWGGSANLAQIPRTPYFKVGMGRRTSPRSPAPPASRLRRWRTSPRSPARSLLQGWDGGEAQQDLPPHPSPLATSRFFWGSSAGGGAFLLETLGVINRWAPGVGLVPVTRPIVGQNRHHPPQDFLAPWPLSPNLETGACAGDLGGGRGCPTLKQGVRGTLVGFAPRPTLK